MADEENMACERTGSFDLSSKMFTIIIIIECIALVVLLGLFCAICHCDKYKHKICEHKTMLKSTT